MEAFYTVGLDLGQTTDYTALAVVERPLVWLDGQPSYGLRHLQRFHLGTPYTQIVPAVARLVAMPPLAGRVTLVADQTGVGRAVVDLLRRDVQCHLVPVTITAGQSINATEDGSLRVPKRDLVCCLQILLQARRLRVTRSLPETQTLVRELENFRVKITESANEVFGAWRQGQHDDLVLAAALACWWAERGNYGAFEVTEDRNARSLIADAPEGVFLTRDEDSSW
jgi:hypothetical protein